MSYTDKCDYVQIITGFDVSVSFIDSLTHCLTVSPL